MIDRIVIINDLAQPMGGASLLALRSAEAFAARGHRVTMITGDAAPERPGAQIEYVCLGQERLLGAGPGAMARGIYNRAARDHVAGWIAANDTPGTVYHLHGWSQILSPALFDALAPVADRLIMSAHDFFLTCPNGAIFDYRAQQPCERVPMSASCLVANCDRRHRAHKLWRTARHFVLNTRLGRMEMPPQLLIHAKMAPLLARSGLAEEDMAVLPNPVTPWTEGRIAAETNRDALFVGRIEGTKGVEMAAEACRRAGIRLVAVGGGAMLDTLRALYPEMVFTGRVDPSDIAKFASTARMLVMPSLYTEPFGLTAIEAAWSGLPVVISDLAFIADDLVGAGAGVAVNPRDPAAMATVLSGLARDDERVRTMSHAAFNDTQELAMTPAGWADALLASYEALLKGGKPALQSAARQWLTNEKKEKELTCGSL